MFGYPEELGDELAEVEKERNSLRRRLATERRRSTNLREHLVAAVYIATRDLGIGTEQVEEWRVAYLPLSPDGPTTYKFSDVDRERAVRQALKR